MSYIPNLHIVAFVGLAGAGKSTAVEYFTSKGVPRVYFGEVILGGMKAAGIDITPENEKKYREELRATHGKDAVANIIVEQIRHLAAAGQHYIVADGLYSWSEYKTLSHAFPGEMKVVAVAAPKHLRHRRLSERPVRPFTQEEASIRDWSEIENLEKGGPIAIADYYLHNDGTKEALEVHLGALYRELGFDQHA